MTIKTLRIRFFICNLLFADTSKNMLPLFSSLCASHNFFESTLYNFRRTIHTNISCSGWTSAPPFTSHRSKIASVTYIGMHLHDFLRRNSFRHKISPSFPAWRVSVLSLSVCRNYPCVFPAVLLILLEIQSLWTFAHCFFNGAVHICQLVGIIPWYSDGLLTGVKDDSNVFLCLPWKTYHHYTFLPQKVKYFICFRIIFNTFHLFLFVFMWIYCVFK